MQDTNDRIERIRSAIASALQPTVLEIIDQSHMHAGHAGTATGLGHFHVRIVAAAFTDQPMLERHRMVYRAMGELMTTDVHALAIDALSPEEARAGQTDP